MAEQVQTSEIANAQLANKGIVSTIGNSLEKLRKLDQKDRELDIKEKESRINK